jgi:hypothetical protein
VPHHRLLKKPPTAVVMVQDEGQDHLENSRVSIYQDQVRQILQLKPFGHLLNLHHTQDERCLSAFLVLCVYRLPLPRRPLSRRRPSIRRR